MTNPYSASVNLTKQAPAAWNERYIDVDGVHIRYVLEGSGPPFLLIHGFGEFLEVWDYNIAPFRAWIITAF
jgi:pimeloyl-ACP methyl ester carboxylesterase